jgi:hypothetical protein
MLRYVIARTSEQYQLPSEARSLVLLHSSPDVLPQTHGRMELAMSMVYFMVMYGVVSVGDRCVVEQIKCKFGAVR